MSYADEVLSDSPLAYWRMGEFSGATTMYDASGNGRSGTYAAGVTLGASGLLASDANTAATFVVSDTYLPWASWQNAANLTVEAWIKTTATGAYQAILDRDQLTGSNRAWQFRVSNTGKLEFVRIVDAAGVTSIVLSSSTATVNDGAAHHVAATYDGTTILLYVDGVLSATTTATGGVRQPTSATKFGIGANHSTGSGSAAEFNGVLDEVAYYGTAIPGPRILDHYSAGIAAPVLTVAGLGSNADHQSPLVTMANLPAIATGLERIGLVTVLGDDTAPGVELAGGGYSRATVTSTTEPMGSGYVHMLATFEALPAADIVGWEGWSADGATRYTYGLFNETLCVARATSDTLCMSGFHGDVGVGSLEFPSGTRIVFHPNRCPSGLTPGAVYFVRDSDGRRFRVALTSGGAPVTLTGDTDEQDPCAFGVVRTVVEGGPFPVGVAVRGTELRWMTDRVLTIPAGWFNADPPPTSELGDWDPATMLGSDGLHPNDTGMTHLADSYEYALEYAGKTPAPGTLMTAYGDSWTATDTKNTPGLRAIDQLRDRLGLTLTNQAVAGYKAGDCAARAIGTGGTFAPGTGGLVVVASGLNDLQLVDTAQQRAATKAHLRAHFAALCAAERLEQPTFSFSSGWASTNNSIAVCSGGSNATTTTEGVTATASISVPGTYYLFVNGTNGSTFVGGKFTVTQGATVLAEVDTNQLHVNTGNIVKSGYGNAAVRIEGVIAGPLVITFTKMGRSGTVVGLLDGLVRISETPPTIVAIKPVRVTASSHNNPTLLAHIRDFYGSLPAEFGANVVVCDPDPGWTI